MKRILMIEDEFLMANVYRDELSCAGFSVEVAADGQSGLQMFCSRKPDLVLLDLMLPQVDGIEVLKAIRSLANPRELPVLVFTNTYLGGMVQSAWEAGASQVITKSTYTPRQVAGMVKAALDDSRSTQPTASAPATLEDRSSKVDPAAREAFLRTAPELVAALRETHEMVADDPGTPVSLEKLYAKVRPVTAAATVAGLQPVARMAEALEGLLKVLSDKPRAVSVSVLLTITQAIDTLEYLANNAEAAARRDPAQARILVVDDDEFARRGVCAALEMVGLKATCVENPARALQEQGGDRFDLIFLDIEMPGGDGYSLCSNLRSAPAYQGIPIIFLSLHADDEHRAESFLRGGNDFISKPFLYMELAVKALSFVMRGSWDNREPATHGPAQRLNRERDPGSVSQSAALPPRERGLDADPAVAPAPSRAVQQETVS
ncbi:MAG TPA: response regulator [Verrucomicrobiae bacterium]|nr:response regulator [Verrucomicrobiae bacterium]